MVSRRELLAQGAAGLGAAAAGAPGAAAAAAGPAAHRVPVLANAFVTVVESPDPAKVFTYTPGIAVAAHGRLIATMDMGGPGAANLPGAHPEHGFLGIIFTSDDHGKTWQRRADFPGTHARPFVSGSSVYVLGHAGDLMALRSDDNGDTWSRPALLTSGQHWHQSACNVHYHRGCVYLVMERRTRFEATVWSVSELAPVLMRARVGDDLTQRASWTFASELPFYEAADEVNLDYFGVPFFKVDPRHGGKVSATRTCAPMGWLETNVVQFVDPEHQWYDPSGHTLHLWMRAHTGGTGYAAIARVVENADGTMTTSLQTEPSGRKALFLPCPGGQMRFHIVYDDRTRLYWLLSSQATDSMTRPDLLPPDRFDLPNNERNRLQLHFSRNCVDWCFAGMVAIGGGTKQSRHYASLAIDGSDLLVLSRSGDHRARSPHDGNLITFHRVPRFRELVY